MPYLIRHSYEMRNHRTYAWEPVGPAFDFNGRYPGGMVLPSTVLTTAIRLTSKARSLPQVYMPGVGVLVVSELAKIEIEKLEPEVHRFVPLDVLTREREILPGKHYLVDVSRRIDAVIIEKSRLGEVVIVPGSPPSLDWLDGRQVLTFDRGKMGSAHLWRLKFPDRYKKIGSIWHHIFMSDKLQELFKINNIVGVDLVPQLSE